MLSKKKKIFVLASMVVLLVVTGTLNVILNNQDKSTPIDASEYASLFDTYRSDRTITHQTLVLDYENIIANENASAEAKAAAESMLFALDANYKLETALEVMLKGTGIGDIFVSCSTNNVNVMVNKEVLSSDEANQILDIILRETDIDPSAVYVNPVRQG